MKTPGTSTFRCSCGGHWRATRFRIGLKPPNFSLQATFGNERSFENRSRRGWLDVTPPKEARQTSLSASKCCNPRRVGAIQKSCSKEWSVDWWADDSRKCRFHWSDGFSKPGCK